MAQRNKSWTGGKATKPQRTRSIAKSKGCPDDDFSQKPSGRDRRCPSALVATAAGTTTDDADSKGHTMDKLEGRTPMTEQHDYFKWVALKEDDPDWYERELLAGRARFGWSPPGADLRAIKDKMDRFSWNERTAEEAEAWSYNGYLILYIHPGSRLVIQTRQPLRSFWLAEVIHPGYQFDGTQDDFNHIFHVKLASQKPIPIDLKEISPSLRHDISKRTVRGKYQIYPEETVAELGRLWERLVNGTFDWSSKRTEAHTFEEMRDELNRVVIRNISRRWKSKNFEVFCEKLCDATDNIEVVSRSDTGGMGSTDKSN